MVSNLAGTQVYARACARACVRACVRAGAYVCVCVREGEKVHFVLRSLPFFRTLRLSVLRCILCKSSADYW